MHEDPYISRPNDVNQHIADYKNGDILNMPDHPYQGAAFRAKTAPGLETTPPAKHQRTQT
ncbi:hypothetical protein FRB94_011804 [Tulasnella sp. JGI-2019a]|nr:hypothetical protein FRB93_002253 [Tulasnella sp. JGI-2019a]KAG9014626.1 hypothetical protein FRB94_011804 [Tulasnella sp. JGI-2019a]